MQRELGVAASLLFDELPPPDLTGVDASHLISLLRRNRVPVAVLPRWRALVAATPPKPLKSYADAALERFEQTSAAYAEVAKAWAAAGIDGVLIKSPGYFPYTSSNVDVLVASDHALDACRILLELGYAEVELAREPYKRLFRKLDAPHLGFPVHVHTAVAWINQYLESGEVVAAARRSAEWELLLYPSPEHVVLITSAHWLYEDKELALRDFDHVARAVWNGADWDAIRARSERGGWGAGLELAIATYAAAAERLGARTVAEALPRPTVSWMVRRAVAHAMDEAVPPFRVSRLLAKGLQVAKSLREPKLAPAARVSEAAAVVYYSGRAKLPTIRRGPSVVVGISGPDGSGKTTLARALESELGDEVGLSVRYRWRRLGSSRALDAARTLAARALGRDGGTDEPAAQELPLKHELAVRPRLRRMWARALGAEFLARAWVDHARARVRGGIQIFDRGAIDAAVDVAEMYDASGRWIASLAPKPTVQLLVLREPPERDGYAGFKRDADLVLRAGDPLGDLVAAAAREVLHAYVAAGRPR